MMIVGVIADLAMGTPRGTWRILRAPMSSQTAKLAHEAKRRKRLQPGKPLRRIWGQREFSPLGTDNHIGAGSSLLEQRKQRPGSFLRWLASWRWTVLCLR